MPKKSTRGRTATLLVRRRSPRCGICDGALRWRVATASKPAELRDYGFPLRASGAATATCRKCRTIRLVVARAEKFDRLLLGAILQKKGALSAADILFLRKHLKMTGGKFASLVGVSREHVSHIEQGHAPNLGTAADRLARLMIAIKCDKSMTLLRRTLASLDEEIGTRARRRPVRKSGYQIDLGSRQR